MNLNQITAPSRDLQVSIPFYQRLGLKLIVHSSDDYARFECPHGDATFSLHRVEHLPSGEGIWIYFECEDLDQQVDRLSAQGIRFDEMPNDKRWLWREARLSDPDGNQLILYRAGDNRKNPPWRLSGDQAAEVPGN